MSNTNEQKYTVPQRIAIITNLAVWSWVVVIKVVVVAIHLFGR